MKKYDESGKGEGGKAGQLPKGTATNVSGDRLTKPKPETNK